MTDLTQFYGEQGLVIDKNFAFTSTSKSNGDLISEMRSNGLLVDFLDTTGNLVRVSVSATANSRPDKSNERSGYYAYNQLDNNFICIYGNWRTSQEWKFTSYNPNEMSAEQKRLMQTKLEESQKRREEAKTKKQEEVSIYAKEKFASANEVTDHNYLNDKKVKSYGLKTINGNLLIPVHSITKSDNGILVNDIKSLQYIFPDGSKKFVGGGEIKGNVFLIGCEATELPYLDTLILCEGYATGSSIFEATGLPVAVVFSANFCLTASVRLRKVTGAKFVIALDNDTSGIGEKNANEVVNAVSNCVSRLPSITGDFNDLHLAKGLDQVKTELTEHAFGLRNYAIRNLVGSPPPIEWLVDDLIPLGINSVLAGVGGIGKSFLGIDLAMKVANGGSWLGKTVLGRGDALIISAEDSHSEVWRRISEIDKTGKRFDSLYDVFIYTVADSGKPLILLKDDELSQRANELVEELKSLKNLKLVIFDPIQAFIGSSMPISSSNEAGQLWSTFTAGISAQLGVTCISMHHMSKQALNEGEDQSLTKMRQNIRGASSIIDGSRQGIVVFNAGKDEAEKVCFEQGEDFDPMKVVKGAVVKSNFKCDTSIKTLFRKGAVLEILDENKKSFEWD